MLKLVDKLQNPISIAISKRSALFKNEDTHYISAFLTYARQRLLPYHSKSLKNFPNKQELNKIYSEIYSEINDLYIDEHETIGNNDYLEQIYDIFSNIHKLVRKYEIVYDLKLEENRKKFLKNDPDQFPIYNLTGSESIPDFKTIWDLKEDFKDEIEDLNGFYLNLKNSKIDHPDSGKGVFLSCKYRKFILPGTVLGFYPGIFYFDYMETAKGKLNDIKHYLKRYDGSWLDPYQVIPYPYRFGLTLQEFHNEEEAASLLAGGHEITYKTIPISYLNPLALAHKINHPPPDTPANVKLIDVNIPFSFFPNDFLRYLPNIFEGDFIKREKFFSKAFRTVAIVALDEIKDEDELYLDYIDEEMVPVTYRPDWLIKPPPRNPFLIKQEYVTKPNAIDKMVNKFYLKTYGKENLEFKRYIAREEGLNVIEANKNIKKIQLEIRQSEQKLLKNDDEKLLY